MTVTQKLQALLNASNAKTGESNTTLTDAVQTLIDGFGQGGGIAPFAHSAVSYFTPAADGITTHDFDFGKIDFTPNFLLMFPVLDANIKRLDWVYNLTYCVWQERKWLADISNGTPFYSLSAVNYGGNINKDIVCTIGEDGVIQFGTSSTDYSYKNGVTYALYALRLEEPSGEV